MVDFNLNLPLGATPLDDVSGLKLTYITTLKELYEAEFQSITQNAGALLLKPPAVGKLLTKEYMFKLHKIMFGDVWIWAGEKRSSNKSVGVDKNLIILEMHKLLENYKFWSDTNVDNIEISARLHHKLVQVHPFENGNGRWSRFVTNLYLLRSNNLYVKWPEHEFFINSEFREKYINALKVADAGDYSNMMTLHNELMVANN